MSEYFPVVVTGGGGCGLVAALAASKRGVRTLVLEKGGAESNTARSTGLIPAAGTRFQREAGITDDSPNLMERDILEKNAHESDPEITRILCETSSDLVEWLADEAGCEIVCHTDFLYPGQTRMRMHGPPDGYGSELLRQLEKTAQAESNIEFRSGTTVTGLLSENGHVVGVRTEGGEIRAEAVILALNGFGGNPEMVREHLGPEAASALYFGSPNNTGEGIRWCMELGADTECMGAYQGHASVAAPDGPLVTWGVVVNGAVLVNREGRRFGRETVGYSEYAKHVLAQPGGEAWEVFDRKVYEASRDTRLEEVIEAGKVVWADTIEELANEFRLPAAALAATVEEVNRTARGEAPDRFGREKLANGLLEPPFCGIHVRGALFHTQGGLRVDTKARALRSDGEPIHGLYAGGGTAAGISGKGVEGYSSGNGLLAALGLGRIAGETAAEALAGEETL